MDSKSYGLSQVMAFLRFISICFIWSGGFKMLWVITDYRLSQYGLSQVWLYFFVQPTFLYSHTLLAHMKFWKKMEIIAWEDYRQREILMLYYETGGNYRKCFILCDYKQRDYRQGWTVLIFFMGYHRLWFIFICFIKIGKFKML